MSNGANDAALDARLARLERRVDAIDAEMLAEVRALREDLREFRSAIAKELARLFDALPRP